MATIDDLLQQIRQRGKSPDIASLLRPSNVNVPGGTEAHNAAAYQGYAELMNQMVRRAEGGPTVPPGVARAIRALDNLGFDSVGRAMSAIRAHSDWMERWDVDPVRSVPEAHLAKVVDHYLKTGQDLAPVDPGGGGGGAKLLPFSGGGGLGGASDQAIGGVTKNTVGRTPLG